MVKINKQARQPAIAGQFYPASPAELKKTVTALMSGPVIAISGIRALVVPHAGYAFSGAVAGKAFAYLKNQRFKKVFLIGPSHYSSFKGAAADDLPAYSTPLGEVKVCRTLVARLLREENFHLQPEAFVREHDLEVELPFLQSAIGDFELVPLLCGNENTLSEIRGIAGILKRYLDADTLVVASVDFTHYGPNYGFVPFVKDIPRNLKKLDDPVIEYLLDFKTEKLHEYLRQVAVTNDGEVVLALLSEIFKNSGCEGELVGRGSSGELTGEYENSVSYVGLVFHQASSPLLGREDYSAEEKEFLLDLSRQTLNYYFEKKKILKVEEKTVPEKLRQSRGVFVTLTERGELRGCIGYVFPHGPIFQSVIENTLNAAFEDPRFLPVERKEADDLQIEISILSEPREVPVAGPGEYLLKLRPGVDGVIVKNGRRSATYLPQVWEEFESPEEFLSSLCRKAGLADDCWRAGETKISAYQAEVFQE